VTSKTCHKLKEQSASLIYHVIKPSENEIAVDEGNKPGRPSTSV
jgi:hypothetical protein